jgi:D-alanyl-D-alanine carboxypeptidase
MGGSLNDLVPELQEFARALVDAAGSAGLQPRITSTLRTRSEQGRLYRRFLAGASGFPVVPPGYSAHEYGEAFDMVVSPMDALADVGYTWQQWGGGWNPSDAVHFELPGATARAAERGRKGGYGVETTFTKVAGVAATLPLPVVPSIALEVASSKPTLVTAPPVWKWTWEDLLDPQGFFHKMSWL